MAHETYSDTELQREQQRLQLALAAGRMCALDYNVGEDHLELWPDGGAACAGFEQLNGSLAGLLQHIQAEDRPNVERVIREAISDGNEVTFEAR
ncbi:MAG: hypothetical protein JO318_14205, partial [Chloroflexi bacterium]|nr:hypothetical protein [Chloroflexota bacterium]